MTDASIFTVGGTVQAGGGVYIARPADDELLQHCTNGDFSFVLTARQMGKSSLMVRTSERLNAIGTRTVIIDLTRLGTKLNAEQWYLGLTDEIVEQLDLELDYKAWWQDHAHLGTTQRLSRLLSEIIEKIGAPLVIFIDEIDTTLALPFADDFFALIRSCYNARSTDPAFRRLAFVLLGVATPSDLISDPARTPFNIGTRIELSDFTLEEAMPLANGLGLPPKQAIEILRFVLDWTGGHPYLTQRLCRALVERPGVNWNAEAVASVVEETFFGEASKQDGNLQFVRDMLSQRAQDVRAALEVYQDVLKGKPVVDNEQSLVITHLKISGAVRAQDGLLIIRNRIYARVFDQNWIRNLKVLRTRRTLQEFLGQFLQLQQTFLEELFTLAQRFAQRNIWAWRVTGAAIALPLIFFTFFMEHPVRVQWVEIPAGSFVMGMDRKEAEAVRNFCLDSPVEDPIGICDEVNALLDWSGRQESATLPEYSILDNEVTFAQYQECVDAGACEEPKNTPGAQRGINLPAANLTWLQAEAYCEWLGGRLPTEAEWEKAGRGPDGNYFPWGNTTLEDWNPNLANIERDNVDTVKSIAAFQETDVSIYGVKNMAGNVQEWTATACNLVDLECWKDRGQKFADPVLTSTEAQEAAWPVIVRGGSWKNIRSLGFASMRRSQSIDAPRENLGFRCVCPAGTECASPLAGFWTWLSAHL